MNLLLANVSPIMWFVAILWLFVAIVLVLIVLIQKGKGGGLSGAFGGAGAGGLLGTKTGDFLTWVTISLAVLFLLLAILMAKYFRPTISDELKENNIPSRNQIYNPPQDTHSTPPGNIPEN